MECLADGTLSSEHLSKALSDNGIVAIIQYFFAAVNEPAWKHVKPIRHDHKKRYDAELFS